MAKSGKHKWEFRARFRRHAFGWRSQPAIKRIREAVSEIKKVARKEKLLAAEGAVLFLEKISPAIEQVDSSSGAIGTAVSNAIEKLVPIISAAPAEAIPRDKWLERLWEAYEEDAIPYIERLGDHWGELCSSKEVASRWADRLLPVCKMAWSPDPNLRGYFKGTTSCLSALLAAERYQELLDLLEMAPYKTWFDRRYGVKALVAMGSRAEAIRYAQEGQDPNDDEVEVARDCEEILLSSGMADEAYRRFGLAANRRGTYLAWFRAVVRKYPRRRPEEILEDLVSQMPGDEGKWFAAAKDARLFQTAIELANRSPCSPQTLTRAARDFVEEEPVFAVEAGVAALRWLLEGYGYEVTGRDVLDVHSHTMEAAANAGLAEETKQRFRDLLARESPGRSFVDGIIGRKLENE